MAASPRSSGALALGVILLLAGSLAPHAGTPARPLSVGEVTAALDAAAARLPVRLGLDTTGLPAHRVVQGVQRLGTAAGALRPDAGPTGSATDVAAALRAAHDDPSVQGMLAELEARRADRP